MSAEHGNAKQKQKSGIFCFKIERAARQVVGDFRRLFLLTGFVFLAGCLCVCLCVSRLG